MSKNILKIIFSFFIVFVAVEGFILCYIYIVKSFRNNFDDNFCLREIDYLFMRKYYCLEFVGDL